MQKLNVVLIGSLLISSLLASAPVMAATLQDYDYDGDGRLSMEETEDIEGLDFYEFDLNSDGTLDESEFNQAIAKLNLE